MNARSYCRPSSMISAAFAAAALPHEASASSTSS
jgi:hypothetical protein